MKSFNQLLVDLNDGSTLAGLTPDLAELLQAVKNNGRSGSMTLKLKVLPANRGGGEVDKITIVADRKLELPKPEQPSDFFWLTDDAQPTRQHAMDLRDAQDTRGGMRKTGTTLLEIATTIQATTGINFSSAKRLQNGQVQMQYTENIDTRAGASGSLEIPKEFTLGLRIFKNGAGYKIKARLKYRLASGAVKFWYELDRPERSIEDAFNDYVKTVTEQSGYTVLLGAA